MAQVFQISDGSPFRFATIGKVGDALSINFVIFGQAGLVGHSWRGQLRGRAGRIASGFGMTLTLTTVTTANDSLQVAMLINSAGTVRLRPDVYIAECEDLTNTKTWATGTVNMQRDYSH